MIGVCPDGEIGKRRGLKILHPYGFTGSTPVPDTMKKSAIDEFEKAQLMWDQHKLSCKDCKSQRVCGKGSSLRSAVLQLFRLAKYVEG